MIITHQSLYNLRLKTSKFFGDNCLRGVQGRVVKVLYRGMDFVSTQGVQEMSNLRYLPMWMWQCVNEIVFAPKWLPYDCICVCLGTCICVQSFTCQANSTKLDMPYIRISYYYYYYYYFVPTQWANLHTDIKLIFRNHVTLCALSFQPFSLQPFSTELFSSG